MAQSRAAGPDSSNIERPSVLRPFGLKSRLTLRAPICRRMHFALRTLRPQLGRRFAPARPARSRRLHCSPPSCRNRLLFEPSELRRDEATGAGYVQLPPGSADSRAGHIDDVLRGAAGQTLRVGVVNDAAALAQLSGGSAAGWRLSWLAGSEAAAEKAPPCDLLLAMPRPKVMKRLWAPLAALGVGAVFVTNAERVERYYFDSDAADGAAVRLQLLRGLEQAGATRLPNVLLSKRLPPVLDAAAGLRSWADAGLGPGADPAWASWLVGSAESLPAPPPLLLVAHPGAARGCGVRAALVDAPMPQRVLLAVGPEGGWSEYELAMLTAAGGRMVSLGDRTLDTHTATVALLAATREAMDAWRED